MNDRGEAAGSACHGVVFSSTNCIAWIWNGAEYKFLNSPGATTTLLYAINNRGSVTGSAAPEAGPPTAFVHDRGRFRQLTIPGYIGSEGLDLDNLGRILVGATHPDGTIDFVIFDRGPATLAPSYPDALATFYNGLNDRGDLAGSRPVNGFAKAFVAIRNH